MRPISSRRTHYRWLETDHLYQAAFEWAEVETAQVGTTVTFCDTPGDNVAGEDARAWVEVQDRGGRHAARTWPRGKRFMIVAPARVSVRFYAELNDHLAPHQRYRTLDKEFFVPASVKDVIESFGIPHTEVELVLVNGESSDFSRLARDGDRVALYPVFESLDVTPELRVRTQALRELKFVLDVHLGRLAAYLRMLGFDTEYRNCASDAELVRISAEQERILLTRDRGLLKHSAVTRGYWLRQTDSRGQAAEVVSRFDLARSLRPFTRCMACNERLRPISKVEIHKRVPPPIAARHEEFHECPACQRVYWQGSHYHRMRRWIEELTLTSQAPLRKLE